MDERIRPTPGYDAALEQRLVAAIILTIVNNSPDADGGNVALQTAETITALCKVQGLVLALSPHARSSATLRGKITELAER